MRCACWPGRGCSSPERCAGMTRDVGRTAAPADRRGHPRRVPWRKLGGANSVERCRPPGAGGTPGRSATRATRHDTGTPSGGFFRLVRQAPVAVSGPAPAESAAPAAVARPRCGSRRVIRVAPRTPARIPLTRLNPARIQCTDAFSAFCCPSRYPIEYDRSSGGRGCRHFAGGSRETPRFRFRVDGVGGNGVRWP